MENFLSLHTNTTPFFTAEVMENSLSLRTSPAVLLLLPVGKHAIIYASSCFNIRNTFEYRENLRRTNGVSKCFQSVGSAGCVLCYTGNAIRLPLPQPASVQQAAPARNIIKVFRKPFFRSTTVNIVYTAVQPSGKPINHSTQSGLSAAVSECGFSSRIICAAKFALSLLLSITSGLNVDLIPSDAIGVR